MNGKEETCIQSRSQIPTGGRRSVCSRPPPNLHSDCPPEQEEDSPSLGKRSLSLLLCFMSIDEPISVKKAIEFYDSALTGLNTLQSGVIQPRMAQLETLEAKMASIEVSLSSTPRRRKNGSIGGLSLGASIRSIPREIATKELENLRNALRDKENIIQSLKGQLTIPGLRLLNMKTGGSTNSVSSRDLTDVEKKQAEERLNRLKTDVDNKRLAIKNLKMALERLDITDNIDVRIQQAELEYQLGREELNLLTLLEETRTLQLCLDESNKSSATMNTLFSCIHDKEQSILVGVEVEFDPKSPKFGAGEKEHGGLWIDWALDDSGLYKEDRIIEVNGKIVLTKTREDLNRLLAAAPDPAQMVVLRKLMNDTSSVRTSTDYKKEVTALRTELDSVRERAEEAQRTKDGLRSDNLRLTHRISYLEEQVSELLNRKLSDADTRDITRSPIVSTVKTNQNITNINITSQLSDPASPSGSSCSKDIQVFQKGSQVTTLIASIPGIETNRDNHTSLPVRSKSSLSNVSNTQITSTGHQLNDNHSCHKSHKHKQKSRNGSSSSCSTRTFDQTNDKITYRKHSHHHHHYREKDYSSETNSAIEQIARYNKKNLENGHKVAEKEANPVTNNIMDQSYQKATKIVNELTKRSDVNSYEKHRQKCLMASEKYNGDILKHYNARKSTSVLDFRSEIHIGPKYPECKSTEELNGSESDNFRQRIQNSHSMKSLDFDSDCNSTKTNGKHFSCSKSMDYTSESLNSNKKLNNYYTEQQKSRPMPPKKPLRLSLHKAQSLQSVETGPNDHKDPRKPMKRSYKGEISNLRFSEMNGEYNGHNNASLKWNFGQNQRIVENGVEMTGSWC